MNYLKLLAIFSCLQVSSVLSLEVKRDVLIRGEKRELVIEEKTLQNLLSHDKYDGEYFKIVEGTSNEAISITDSQLSRKAANAYYHLEKARNYFQSLGVSQKNKAVIRVDIQNAFHRHFHFQNADVNPVFNNATTIYRGEGNSDFGISSWGNEIWFRPPKKVKLPERVHDGFIKTVESAIPTRVSFSTEALAHTGLSILNSENKTESLKVNAEDMAIRYLRNKAIRYFIPRIGAAFLSDMYYLDAVFVPEIIYHEYAHLIMADKLPPVSNNPLIEGVADFFAAEVANSKFLADELGQYGENIRRRNAENREYYEMSLDSKKGLGSDFILSVFYQIDQEITSLTGEEDYFAKRLFEMRRDLSPDSEMRSDLPDLCWEHFPRFNRHILAILHQRGI